MSVPADTAAQALTKRERDWLAAMPPWSDSGDGRVSGVTIAAKFYALVAELDRLTEWVAVYQRGHERGDELLRRLADERNLHEQTLSAVEAALFGENLDRSRDELVERAELARSAEVELERVTRDLGVAARLAERAMDDRDKAKAELVAAARREERLRDVLTRIVANAEAWHGPLADTGHERALAVIAQWGREPVEEGQQP